MRLTQIKLSGFKSFVDPTGIGTPGQLVGIVGPNGCGKSNVIDAVRWVLGESKASALRGESMQDVIFNGAGDRKPVGRASVELQFDNSAGRIGGQWGSYAEISIKRVLTRDGDSSYYINNIPVRRRDIHDLFLGTGLGPRAYAIIEQGMISRVIEAKPEELRVFLEEAAGVSKYKERRKETEGRLSDTRENLARVEDIRIELGNQLARLEQQAKVAGEYRELEARLRQSQQLLWFAKQQDAVRARERCTAEIAQLTVALDAVQAELRSVEARLETLRHDHYSAGDALHERQGAFYAANSEVTRLEQQLAFARENENRITQQVAQLTEALGALAAQEAALAGDRAALERSLEEALAARESAAAEEQAAQAALPALEQALVDAARTLDDLQQTIALTEQGVRVAEAQRESAARTLLQFEQRRERIDAELAGLAAPVTDDIRVVEEQLAQEAADLHGKEASLASLQQTVQSLQEQQRQTSEAWQQASRQLADLEARESALSALQAKVGHGNDKDAWLERAGLVRAAQLWQAIDVERGWNDALEAMLRERLEALELDALDRALRWESGADQPPVRLAVYAPAPSRHEPQAGGDALLAKVRLKRAEVGRLVADALFGVRCRDTLEAALADRGALALGESFVTPAGHIVTAQTVTLFKPDGELHGVLERQRELEELAGALGGTRMSVGEARAILETVEIELKDKQQAYHAEGLALASQQRRCHDLELELMQLKQAAEAAEKRRAQLMQERADLDSQQQAEHAQHGVIGAQIADLQSRLHDELAKREAGGHTRDEAELALARGRERVRTAERASQEAGFAERSARDRLADLERRRETLSAQGVQQRSLLAQVTSERQSIDWTPVEEALQRQLATRGEAEHCARLRARSAGGAGRGAAQCRGGAPGRRAEAGSRADQDPGDAAKGAGGAARRAAVH